MGGGAGEVQGRWPWWEPVLWSSCEYPEPVWRSGAVLACACRPHSVLACPAGDLEVTCAATGLSACLTFKEGGLVKGTLERQRPSVPAHSGSGAYGGAGSGGGGSSRPGNAGSSAASVTSAAATAGGGTAALPYGVLGNFSGSLREGIRLVCPALVGGGGGGGRGGRWVCCARLQQRDRGTAVWLRAANSVPTEQVWAPSH